MRIRRRWSVARNFRDRAAVGCRRGSCSTDGNLFGDRLAAFAVDHMAQYRIEYVIFRQRINLGSGWTAMADRGSITQNHFDHVHVSFLP